jgi:hypothetical protein
MSRSTWMLVLLNAVWLAVASWYIVRHFDGARVEPRTVVVTNYVPMFKASRPATPAPITVVTNIVSATNDFRWAQLESEDYRDYIARLRSIGCPEQTIRDLVIADVDKMFAPRMQASGVGPREMKYWQPVEQELWDGTAEQAAQRQQRAVDYEKREVIRQLLGVDLIGERLRVQGQVDYHGQRLGFLPEDKRAQVRSVLDQFADKERELMEEQIDNGDGFLATGDLARIRQQKEAALAPLLTPEEREQYDLWFSDSATRVRDSVFGMDATEEEFLKLYKLQKNFDAKSGSAENQESLIQFYQQAREVLGEARYGEWMRAQDPEYREIARVTSRFQLPTTVAAELYSYKQPIEEERAKVEADPNLTPNQKEAAYRAIAEETKKIYQQALGEKAFRHYSRRTSNPWVRAAQ